MKVSLSGLRAGPKHGDQLESLTGSRLTARRDEVDPIPGMHEVAQRSIVGRIAGLMSVSAGALIVALMSLTVVDVVKRRLWGAGVPGALEWTEVLLVFVVFAGMAATELKAVHVRTPILIERLSRRLGLSLRALGGLVVTGIVVISTYETAVAAQRSVEIREFRFGLMNVPVWPARLAIPVGLAGLALALLYRARIDACDALAASVGAEGSDHRSEDAVNGSRNSNEVRTDRGSR